MRTSGSSRRFIPPVPRGYMGSVISLQGSSKSFGTQLAVDRRTFEVLRNRLRAVGWAAPA